MSGARLLTATAISNRLNLTRREIDSMVKKQEIPFVKLPNGRIRFEMQAVDEWIQKHNIPSGKAV